MVSAKAYGVYLWQPKLAKTIVKTSFAVGTIAVIVSMALLVVTITQLRFNIQGEYLNPNAANWDAKLIFNIAPRPSSFLAFAVSPLPT